MKRSFSAIFAMLLTAIVLLPSDVAAQCSSTNTAFKSGEVLGYDLYFNWKFVWVNVGTANLSIKQSTYGGQPAYCASLITRTAGKADKYFVMRDTLTAFMGTDLVPKYYRKRAREGKDYRCDDVWYSYPSGKCNVKMRFSKNGKPAENKSASSKYCAFDMVSMMMRARSFNAGTYKKGQRIPFLMAEGKHCEWRDLVYHGKQVIKMENSSDRYRCLVFSYVEKEKGKEKEIIRFYITDDANHVPVMLDMHLNFGSAKAYLRSAKGLRNATTAKV